MNRERIGRVVKSDGTSHDVYLLKMGDVVDLDFTARNAMHELAARSMGITYKEFMEWDIADGFKVMTIVSNAYTLFSKV